MDCLYLYNPNSGRGRVARKRAYIEKQLKTAYDRVDVYAAADAQDLEAYVRAHAERYDTIVFSGGDGTFNCILQGLEGRKVRLGYIPGGTVNDVARSLGIPRSVRGAVRTILTGRAEPLDCLRLNGTHYAMYVAAAGAFTNATYSTPQSQKRIFGRLAYAFRAIRKNMKLEVFPVHAVCGKDVLDTHAVLVLAINGRSVAGFPINRKASMQDGTLEFVVVEQKPKPNVWQKLGAYLSLVALFLFGCRVRKRNIKFFRGSSVQVGTAEDVVWDLDGEEGTCGDMSVEICPRAVELIVPKKRKKI